MKTILKYPGSKGSMRDTIISMMPAHTLYGEPYGGSAAVLLAKPSAAVEWYNDTFAEVLNLFQIIRAGGEQLAQLCALVELTAFSRAELALARSFPADVSDIERARMFLTRSWLSYGGSLSNHKSGFRTSKTDTKRLVTWNGLSDRLRACAERFKDVYIEQIDATKFMMTLDSTDALFYVDPPYPEATLNFREKQVYDKPFLMSQHEDLLCVLQNLKAKVILSGYRCELYDEVLTQANGWERTDIDHVTQAHSTKTECLWTNYALGGVA
jgi:DNA adenine methylase